MNEPCQSRRSDDESPGIVARGAIATGAVGGVLAVTGAAAYALDGREGLIAAAAAAGVCLAAVLASIVLAAQFGGREQAAVRLLVGMVLRMSIPLAACVIVVVRAPSLAAAGFLYYAVVFYLAMLAAEVLVALSGRRPIGSRDFVVRKGRHG